MSKAATPQVVTQDVFQVQWQEDTPKPKTKKASKKSKAIAKQAGSTSNQLYASAPADYYYPKSFYTIVWADDIIKALQKFVAAKPKTTPLVVSRLVNYEAII